MYVYMAFFTFLLTTKFIYLLYCQSYVKLFYSPKKNKNLLK